MSARPFASSTAAALVAFTIVLGRGRLAEAADQLPVLRLGNQQDCCVELMPAHPPQNCPPSLVPPLYLPSPPRVSAPDPQASPPAAEEPAGEMVPIKRAEPKPENESAFAVPSDLGEIFSEERTERLNKLNTLLDTLHERLRHSVPPLEFQDTAAGDSPIAADSTASTKAADNAAGEPETPTPPVLPESESRDTSSDPPSVPPAPPEVIVPSPAALTQQAEPVSVTDLPVPPTPAGPTGRTAQSPAGWIAQTAVDAPVDRLALADNLYAAGETASAFNIYREIDMETLSDADRRWVQLQLASCHRRLGNDEEASKYYRMLVNVDNPAWMAETARWWLTVLDKRKSMVRQSSELDAIIQQLREQVNAERRR